MEGNLVKIGDFVEVSSFNPLINVLNGWSGKINSIESVNGRDKFHVEFENYGLVVMYDFNFMYNGIRCGEYFDDSELYKNKKSFIKKIFSK